jgi:hypothetical protein
MAGQVTEAEGFKEVSLYRHEGGAQGGLLERERRPDAVVVNRGHLLIHWLFEPDLMDLIPALYKLRAGH